MKKIFSIFIFVFFAFFAFTFPSFASAKEFSSFYKTTYRFANSAEAFVTQEVSLVNLTADLYVSEYSLSILGGQIDSIEAFDKVGPVKVRTQVKDETTIITLQFNEKVVGKEKMLSFILKYRCGGLAKKEGNLWQISIPKLAKVENIDEYELFLKIPVEFGKIAYIDPPSRSEEVVDRFYEIGFVKEDLADYGVWITVGQYQTFDFLINYNLTNSVAVPRIEKIALPPDTAHQTVFYQRLEPEPLDLETDSDGNWLASYRLLPREKLIIQAQGKVNLFFQSKKGRWVEPETNETDYLKSTKNWPTDSSQIKELALKLKTPAGIYRYVSDNLTYDYYSIKKGISRKGALAALENPNKAICTDFTDLFIALCRAAEIPARELAGYAHSDNPKLKELAEKNDLLHSWPEYYDKQKQEWIMVDPTWEQTSGGIDYFNKFDMAHFVFVVHGKSDTLPLSPGAYKEEENQEKQVFISLSREGVTNKSPSFSIVKIQPQTIFPFKRNVVEVEMKNESGFSLNNEVVRLEGTAKYEPNEWFFKQIPPFSHFKIAFAINPVEQVKDYPLKLILKAGDQSYDLSLLVNSLVLRAGIGAGVLFGIALAALLLSLRKGRYSKQKKDVILETQ